MNGSKDVEIRLAKLESRITYVAYAVVATTLAGALCVMLLTAHLYHDSKAFAHLYDVISKYHEIHSTEHP